MSSSSSSSSSSSFSIISASSSSSINSNTGADGSSSGGGLRRGFSNLSLLDADFDYISHEQQAAVMQERKKKHLAYAVSADAKEEEEVSVPLVALPAAPAPQTAPAPPAQPSTRPPHSETQTDSPFGTNDYTCCSSSPRPAHEIHRHPTGGFDPREPGVSPDGVQHVQAYVAGLRRRLSGEVTKEAEGLLHSVVHVRWECHNPDHHVDLYHGLLLGGRRIYLDDRLMIDERKVFDSGSQHEFTLRTTKVTVVIECKNTKFEYKLLINGEPLETYYY